MTLTLTLLHTAQVHPDTFDALRDDTAPDAELNHLVRPDWLARAQGGIDAALEDEIAQAIAAARGPVLCTCTTLGPTAAAHGAIRIDQPMMTRAADIATATGGAILMVYCLDSTLVPSVALLDAALEATGKPAKVHTLSLGQFWPLFEAGQSGAFAAVIAAGIRDAVPDVPNLACVVLAQASMAGAAPLLSELDVPTLASPELALRAALGR